MIRELNIAELLDTLRCLDSLLDEQIEVRAVGEFALAWHRVRKNGLTADIDTITDDYSPAVINAIAQVGERMGLGKWWLNNDAAADDADFLIESMGLRWEHVDCEFRNIELYVANLESLLSLKLAALEDSRLSGRARDLDDIVSILVKMGITKDEFAKRFSYLQYDQPYAYSMVMKAIW